MIGSIKAITTNMTIPAKTSSIMGSSRRTTVSNLRKVVFSRLSAIVTSTLSKLLDSSATEIISTTVWGKCPLLSSCFASRSPAEISSLAATMDSDKITFPAACRLISSDLNNGTPFWSKVPRTRQNRETAKFKKTLPIKGVLIFSKSALRLPLSVFRY